MHGHTIHFDILLITITDAYLAEEYKSNIIILCPDEELNCQIIKLSSKSTPEHQLTLPLAICLTQGIPQSIGIPISINTL